MRALDAARKIARLRLYDSMTHGTFERGRDLLVPRGQSVYDPKVFGRFDLETQQVVPAEPGGDGIWQVGFDEDVVYATNIARDYPSQIERDRYKLALPLLSAGTGVCLDACTATPDPVVREHIDALGFEYLPIDIDGDGEVVRREDVTSLSFGDGSVQRIISLDTLEHVESYQAALGEFARVLEVGGVLVVHVPTYYYDRKTSAPLDPADDPWGHVRYFSGRELVEAIRQTGLSLLRVQLHLDYGAILVVAAKSRRSDGAGYPPSEPGTPRG
jgi:SAM-dependent methyltransferase